MPDTDKDSSWPWSSAVAAGILAGLVLGWVVRGTLASRDLIATAGRPAAPPSRPSDSPPELLRESPRQPWVIQSPTETGPQDLDSSLAALRTVCDRFGAHLEESRRLFEGDRERERVVSVTVPTSKASELVRQIQQALGAGALCGRPEESRPGSSTLMVGLLAS